MKKYLDILKSNYLYYYFIAVFLLIISLHYHFFIMIFIIYLSFNRKKYEFKLMLILLFLIVFLFYSFKTISIPESIDDEFFIVDIKKYEISNMITIKKDNKKYNLYTKENYEVGEYIYVKGEIEKYKHQRVPNGFDQFSYYFGNGILGKVINYKIEVNNEKYNYFYYLYNVIDKNTKSKMFNKFVNNNNDDEISDILNSLNVSYLLTLSGIHIYFLFMILDFFLRKTTIKKDKQEVAKIFIVGIFVILSKYSFSSFRFLIYYVLKYYKTKNDYKITNYSLLNMSFLVLVLLNPFYMFNTSVFLSYLLISAIVLLRPFYKDNSFLIKTIKISLIVTIVMLPISGEINMINIVLNFLYTAVLVYVYFPITILSLFVEVPVSYMYVFLQTIAVSSGRYTIYLPKINGYFKLIYYMLIVIFIKTKKIKRVLSAIMIVIIILLPKIIIANTAPKLFFLDVGQGDSAVYLSKTTTVVIDAYQNVASFLRGYGINTIDFLILSHSDKDHILEAESLLKEFKVKSLVLSMYDNGYNLYHDDTKFISASHQIKFNELKIDFLSPYREYEKKNDNSLVFTLKYDDTSVLFTGDILIDAENDITRSNRNIKSDVIKVPHHGSITSSSLDFIKKVAPRFAIISVASNNAYKMPSDEVIKRYKYLGVSVYQTDIHKTILYYKNRILDTNFNYEKG